MSFCLFKRIKIIRYKLAIAYQIVIFCLVLTTQITIWLTLQRLSDSLVDFCSGKKEHVQRRRKSG